MKALPQLVVDLIFIINRCDEIERSINLTVVIFADNNQTIQLSGSLFSRVKRSNFIGQNVTLGLIEVQKVASGDNIADVLRKPLA